jgi:hypothetical protein
VSGSDEGKECREWWLWPLAILLGGLVVAIALFVAGTIHSGDLGLELAKGGIQLLVVAILGGVVGFGFRNLDEHRTDQRRREDKELTEKRRQEDDRRLKERRQEDIAREGRRRLDEYRAGFVAELWSAYHRVKAVRRTLTAYGFASKSGTLSEEQCREYDLQMKELDDAQLSLETLMRAVEYDDGRIFGDGREHLRAKLDSAQGYVNHVIGDWEVHRGEVRPGAERACALATQQHLGPFLDEAHVEHGMKKKLSLPVAEAVRFVQELRFSLDRNETS